MLVLFIHVCSVCLHACMVEWLNACIFVCGCMSACLDVSVFACLYVCVFMCVCLYDCMPVLMCTILRLSDCMFASV